MILPSPKDSLKDCPRIHPMTTWGSIFIRSSECQDHSGQSHNCGAANGWISHLKLVVHKEWFEPSGDTAHILEPGVHAGGVAAEHFLREAGYNICYDFRRVLCARVVIRQDHPVGLQEKETMSGLVEGYIFEVRASVSSWVSV